MVALWRSNKRGFVFLQLNVVALPKWLFSAAILLSEQAYGYHIGDS